MVTDDPFLEMQGKFAALEYVQKFTLQVIQQLAPGAGAQAAMLTMLDHSIKHAKLEIADPVLAEEMKSYVRQYATQIINSGFNAKNAN